MSGIRTIWRFAALAVCAVVAPVTVAQSQPTASTQVDAAPPLTVKVVVGLNYANFVVRTPSPTRVMVNFGTDRSNMISLSDRTLKVGRILKLSPMAPRTRYYWRAMVVNKRGAVLVRGGQFTTGKMNRPVMTVSSTRVLLNGVKTYPIMTKAYSECPTPQVVASNWIIRAQYMHHQSGPGRGYGCPNEEREVRWLSADELHSLLAGNLGWIQDGPRVAPGQPDPPSWDFLPELVSFQAKLAFDREDAALISCQEGWGSATALFDRVRQHAARGPLIHKVLLVRTIVRGVPSCLTAKKVPAMFWIPILAGAAGIHYQTQSGALPSQGFDVDEGVATGVARETQRLATLYPVLFSGKTEKVSSSSNAVKVLSKSWGGSRYIIALNTDNRPIIARVTTRMSGRAKVLWENRSVVARSGFSDKFDAHEVHVYSLSG